MRLGLGLQGEIGEIVAGSERADFPRQTERLILSVAANQASIGLQGAGLLSEQKHVARELDRRVAQRTRELAKANEELQLQVGLLQLIPVAAWTLGADGTPDFVNQNWLEYTGSGTRLRPVGSRGLDDGDPPRGSGDGVQQLLGRCALPSVRPSSSPEPYAPVFVSAQGTQANREKAMSRGATGFLSKPFRRDDLVRLVEAATQR
jgi:DNA-binding NarL/FixJ family response regulator